MVTVYRVFKTLLPLTLTLLLLGCSNSNNKSDHNETNTTQECNLTLQKADLHTIMQDSYYWYSYVPKEVNYEAHETLPSLLDSLTYKTYDKWSFVGPKQSFDQVYEEGVTGGYGFYLGRMIDQSLIVFYAYPDSPAGNLGLERSDRITAINGVLAGENLDAYYTGSFEATVQKRDGSTFTATLTQGRTVIKPVLDQRILEHDGHKTGYLLFQHFIGPAAAPLEEAFENFKKANIDSLVIDLRYNGGGFVSIAKEIASRILPESQRQDAVFIRYQHNDRYPHMDRNERFTTTSSTLGLSKVAFIFSRQSCSASELLANSLRPYIDVRIVGDTSCGKPAGMYGVTLCDHTLAAVNFTLYNADGEGDYFDGLAPHCAAIDDPTFSFGDPEEPMLKAALAELYGKSCPAQSRQYLNIEPLKHEMPQELIGTKVPTPKS